MPHEESAMSRWPAFMLFTAVAVWSELPAQFQDDNGQHRVPIAKLAQYEFSADPPDRRSLGVVSGTWATSGGTFNSTSTATSIATIDSYVAEFADHEDPTEIFAGKFWYRARMLNQHSGSSTRVGIVYQYQGPGNFYEVSFSPAGSVFVRDVSNGVSTTVATGTYSGGGQNKWFDVEVEWTAAETIVWVNGLPVVQGIKQDRLTHGRVGLITRQTTAKFDRLLVTREYGDPEFRESFSAGAPSWEVIKGNWSVANGVYQNSAVQHGSITVLPIFVSLNRWRETRAFTVFARMLNPYGGSGNRMGFVFNFGSQRYGEIVFGGDGIARVNEVETWVDENGKTNMIVTPLASAPYPGARNQWFDVKFDGIASRFWVGDGTCCGGLINVSVDGTPVFTELSTDNELNGFLGLVTNWTPGRFDDVWFCHQGCGGGGSVTETFDSQNPKWLALRGTWDQEGGVLNNRTAGASDIVYAMGGSTDYTVTARMLNPYRASGNRIGLIFSFDPATGDYYEVVFAPTGQAYFNKFIQGQLTQLATATHSALGPNVWFNVELVRRGPNATVKVNNQIVFANVPAAQLDRTNNDFGQTFGGRVGVISHWAPGRFDNLRIEGHPVR
jgi:hypothetical protein